MLILLSLMCRLFVSLIIGATQEAEEETEDEDEVVTPGEVTDFTMSSQEEKKKPADARVVIAEASTEAETSCVGVHG